MSKNKQNKQKSNKPASAINNKRSRFEFIDFTRSIAILLMFVYHFCYDLDYFGFIDQNFDQDDFWINFRILIVSLFLGVMGISLYLASYRGLNKKRFQQRLLLLVGYSALVTFSSWLMYPEYYIYFGILHFITIASVLGLAFTRLGRLNLLLGVALIILPVVYEHPFFDHPWLHWVGLMTRLPETVDYVPLLPWFGIVLIGIYLGQLISQLPNTHPFLAWRAKNRAGQIMVLGGKYSLHIYMLHQPIFLGILYIIVFFIR